MNLLGQLGGIIPILICILLLCSADRECIFGEISNKEM